MKIIEFDKLNSTQIYLIELIKNKKINDPTCILAKSQSSGIGSRGNEWINVDNGLYFSFCLQLENLPTDLKIESSSIFFGFIFKQNLENLGSKIWLKWPNDLYLEQNKIGGVICNVTNSFIVCGIGLNLKSRDFTSIEDGIIKNTKDFLKQYLLSINNWTWKKVFATYKQEFYKNYNFSFHYNNEVLSFKNSKLLDNGAIKINNEIIYSMR